MHSLLISGIVPDIWKKALIVPVPKLNNHATFKDLKPFSILPAASKILQECVRTQILDNISQKSIRF